MTMRNLSQNRSTRATSLLKPLLVLLMLFSIGNATADGNWEHDRPLQQRSLLFSRISAEDGLSQASIHSIVQDAQGYIWFGTQEGLNRFDGQDIKIYEHHYADPTSLSDNWVWTLFVGADGSLWVGTEDGGLNRFDRDGDSFEHFQHNPDDPQTLGSNRVRVIYQDSQGYYWVGTDGGGLNRLDEATGQVERFQHDPEDPTSLPVNSVLAITEDRTGNIWVGTKGGGLSRLEHDSGHFTHFQHNPSAPNSLSNDEVRAIHQDREGRLWVGTYEGGLNLFNPGTGDFEHFLHDADNPRSLSNNRVRSIYEDRQGTLWVGTDNGLNEWRPAEDGFAQYHHDSTDISSISDNRVTTMAQDRGGVLWVGTYNGINKWNYLSDAFTYFQTDGTLIKLSSNIVTSFGETRNGEVWVGTYGGGLNRINPVDESSRFYRDAEYDNENDPATSDSVIGDDRVMTVHISPDQKVWIGTRGGGLSVLDPDTDSIKHYRHDPENPYSLGGDSVTSVLAEASGSVWVGTYGGGLNRLDRRTGRFTRFRHDPADPASISTDRVLTVYRDSAGNLWVGTEDGGLNRLDERSQKFIRYSHDPSDERSLSRDSAWAIHESMDGSLWVGTNGGGLNRWNPRDRANGVVAFTHYRKNKGLLSDSIQAIVEDSAGYMWLSSNRGLAQLDPKSGEVRQITRSNGLKSSEFNYGAGMRSQAGRLIFGGSAGVVSFYPNQIPTNRHEPDIVLSAATRLGSMDTRYSIDGDGDELELGYRDDLITFEFTGLDYVAPERNQYRYMLEGFDQDWSEPLQFKRATYTSLPAGVYTFRIQAANNDGVWNERGAAMQLRVIPPPWLTAWAYVGYMVLAFAILFTYVRFQSRRLDLEMQQRQELEKQVAVRTQELASSNDELLSLNVQLKESSWTDSLTGLKNRRYLDEFIEGEVAMAQRQNQDMDTPNYLADSLDIAPALSFMMVDLDGFKAINDQYGHQAGDEALLQVRDVLQSCCRRSDTIIRWGGDEFLIISRNTSNRAAEKLAERIRVGLAEHQYQLGAGHIGNLTGSIGFAVYPFSPLRPDLVTWEQVSALADQCAYIAKENGRNAWVGIYGTKTTTAEDIAQLKHNFEGVLAKRRIGIRTSVYGKLNLSERRQQEST